MSDSMSRLANAHRKLKTSLLSIVSVLLLLGLAYCPAMRPMRTCVAKARCVNMHWQADHSFIMACIFNAPLEDVRPK
jgi:hypothetical protein